jgi:hypothetical protein
VDLLTAKRVRAESSPDILEAQDGDKKVIKGLRGSFYDLLLFPQSVTVMLRNSLSCFVSKGGLDAFRGEHEALDNGAYIQDAHQ